MSAAKRPMRLVCPRCSVEDFIETETLGPSFWRYTCTRSCRQHAEPVSWTGSTPDAPVDMELTYNKAEELGLPNDLLRCLEHGEPFVEYGIVEYRYATKVNPDVYAQLVADYGHTALGPKQYTASTFIASTLGRMLKEGLLAYRGGHATGFWSYNSGISFWSLAPVSSEAPPITFKAFALERGLDPKSWPPLGYGLQLSE
jgi:hypothetical protein